jgi:phosphate-selective porin
MIPAHWRRLARAGPITQGPPLRARLLFVFSIATLAARAAEAEPASTGTPLAGFSDQTAFLRSPDDMFQLFPSGRVQIDTHVFASDDKVPNDTFLLRRTRVEARGWIAKMFYFHLGGDFAVEPPASADPVAQTNLAATDEYISIAPWRDVVVLQIGQFDAPFTLENRTPDTETAFIERAQAVRALAVPQNKEQGAMLWGLLPDRLGYYSVGVLNGDGQNFQNVDESFDVMGRAWIAPFARSRFEALDSLSIGGSGWYGVRKKALPMYTETTTGGFAFWTPKWTVEGTTNELHQDGTVKAWGLELCAPIAHKLELSAEYVNKRQQFNLVQTPAPAMPPSGRGSFEGYGVYGVVGYWLLGDGRIVGRPGLELPRRLDKFTVTSPRHGVMVGVRAEYLHENTSDGSRTLLTGSSVAGTTTLRSVVFGVNYWRSNHLRASFNYANNHFSGTSAFVTGLPSHNESELLFRLAVAL